MFTMVSPSPCISWLPSSRSLAIPIGDSCVFPVTLSPLERTSAPRKVYLGRRQSLSARLNGRYMMRTSTTAFLSPRGNYVSAKDKVDSIEKQFREEEPEGLMAEVPLLAAQGEFGKNPLFAALAGIKKSYESF